MLRARIAGTGRAVPDKVLTNDDLAKMVATSDEWIRERTGIGERRILEEGRTTSDLASRGGHARAARRRRSTRRRSTASSSATISPDMPMPAVAVTVQQKLGVTGQCPAFDISAACAGFIYGMSIADSFIKRGQFKRVLVIGVEILSRLVDWTDRNTCVLFGDGAGAAVLVPHDAGQGRARHPVDAPLRRRHGRAVPQHPGRRLGRADDGRRPSRPSATSSRCRASRCSRTP